MALRIIGSATVIAASLFPISCDQPGDGGGATDPAIYRIPVVVHVIHRGEPEGTRFNISTQRIRDQIRILNEDYRRKKGTNGYNEHPDGGDARIEFVLAQTDPSGQPTNGIVRVNRDALQNPVPTNDRFNYYAWYSYWSPEHYLNIWTEPLPETVVDVVLGSATGPDTDLPGADLLLRGEPYQAEGILINSFHFGVSDASADYNLGRTLTHEVGHYLGVLHPWGGKDCENNDYCDDTPPVTAHNSAGCSSVPLACNGMSAMTANFMDYTPDRCVNIFTNDQIARMHYVLETSRRTLVRSSEPS